MSATTQAFHRNRYRDTATATILEEVEVSLWDLKELEADIAAAPGSWEYPDQSRAFIVTGLAEAEAELARRDRLRHRPGAPPWPDRWPDRREELAAIKAAIDFPRFIEEMGQTRLESRGRQLVGRCPLPGHADTTPSFTVHPEKHLFYCHGCHRGGDLFTFAMHMLGTDRFGEVVDALAIEAGIARASKKRANVG